MKIFTSLLALFLIINASYAQLSYEQGFFKDSYFENGNNISEEKANGLMDQYDLSKHHLAIAKKNELVSTITSIVSAGSIGYFLFKKEPEAGETTSGADAAIAVVGLGAAITSLVTYLKGVKSKKAAIKSYNDNKDGKIGFEPSLLLTPNSVGVAFRIR